MSVCPIEKDNLGQFVVNSNGQSTYTVPIVVPAGIGDGNTPELSLHHQQDSPNGLVGRSWLLQGLSSISRAPRNLAIDGVSSPVSYHRDGCCFTIDGVYMILRTGKYGEPDAVYSPEINTNQTITATGQGLQQGFYVRNADGRVLEFGTTEDSRELSNDGLYIRQWRISRNTDVHGNCMTFMYNKSPRLINGGQGSSTGGISYPDTIFYTTNYHSTESPATRFVRFYYEPRNDVVVATGAGDIFRMEYRLNKISVTIKLLEPNDILVREYSLRYMYSGSSQASQITDIQETGSDRSALTPTTITYETGADPANWFQSADYPTELVGPRGSAVQTVLPLNIAGKALSDVVVVSRDLTSGIMSLTTYLANIKDVDSSGNSTLQWARSQSLDGFSELPPIDYGSVPDFMLSDLNGDGRNDLVMAYNHGGGLRFSLSRCTGTGFSPYTVTETAYAWHDNDKFFAMDCNGNGRVDILQVTSVAEEVVIRVYLSDRDPDGDYILKRAEEIWTQDQATNTLFWLPADLNRDGLQDLIRVWYQEDSDGLMHLRATSYIAKMTTRDGAPTFEKAADLHLGAYLAGDVKDIRVLPCDINSDGIQDLVTCRIKPVTGSDTGITFDFKVFFCDGNGGFKPGPERQLQYTIPGQTETLVDTALEALDVDGSGLQSIVFRYRDMFGNQNALVSRGNYSGQISDFTSVLVNQSNPNISSTMEMVSVDINGSGKSTWLAYSRNNSAVATMLPIYNMHPIADSITSITDPLGLCTKPTYRPLTLPSVYRHVAEKDSMASTESIVMRQSGRTLPNKGPFVPVYGIVQNVVSRFSTTNDPSRNGFGISFVATKFYEEAQIDLGGRGWEGFARVLTMTGQATSPLQITHYKQKWPLTGSASREDIYPHVDWVPDASLTGVVIPDQTQLARSTVTEYTSTKQMLQGGATFQVLKTRQTVKTFDGGRAYVGTATAWDYENDPNGFVHRELSYSMDSKGDLTIFESGTRTIYQSSGSVIGIPKTRKSTTVEANLDLDKMSGFLTGDISLTNYTYSPQKASIVRREEWLECNKRFATFTYDYDLFGNQNRSTNPAGLTTKTVFDSVCHSFPIQSTESGRHLAHPLVRLHAFDARFDEEIASTQYNGQLSTIDLDPWGRKISENTITLPRAQNASPANVPHSVIALTAMSDKMSKEKLTQVRKISYSSVTNNARSCSWWQKTVQNLYSEGDYSTASTQTQYVDCRNIVIQTATREGQRSWYWTYRTFDQRRNLLSESIPIDSGVPTDPVTVIQSTPDVYRCTTKTYDILDRILIEIKPAPKAGEDQLMITNTVSQGGLSVVSKAAALKPGKSVPESVILSQLTMKMEVRAGKLKVKSSTNEVNETTSYRYDAAGRLSEVVDPGGKIDKTYHDLQGFLIWTDNAYQNPSMKAQHALQMTYYDDGSVKTVTNANNEVTNFTYDTKQRLTSRNGFDGRTINYHYDETTDDTTNGLGHLTSCSTSQPFQPNEIESRYIFTIDPKGQILKLQTILGLSGWNKGPLNTNFEYDLQGEIQTKTFPDLSFVKIKNSGNLASTATYRSVDAGTASAWDVKIDYEAYDQFGHCKSWKVTPSGQAGTTKLQGSASFDNINNCRSRRLSTLVGSQTLFDESAMPDTLGRQHTRTDELSKKTKTFDYKAKRLHSSVSTGDSAMVYDYSLSGDLKQKNGVAFAYTAAGVTGTKSGATVFQVTYDDSGRMTSRTHNGKTYQFKYNAFDKVAEQSLVQGSGKTSFIFDCFGKKLAQVNANGSIRVTVSSDYSVYIETNGSSINERILSGPSGVIGRVTTRIGGDNPGTSFRSIATDTKGDAVGIFNAAGTLERKLTYDDFGMLNPELSTLTQEDATITYESRSMSTDTGLLEFSARLYDPVLGRFTTPDTQISNDPLLLPDVFNRYVFENNDPVNSLDPTGHWTWCNVVGILVGVALLAAAITITVTTAGAASILLAAVAGGLYGAAFSGIGYSLTHDGTDPGEFFLGYTKEVAIGFATGFVMGAAGEAFSAARTAAAVGRATKAISNLKQLVQRAGRAISRLPFGDFRPSELRSLLTTAGRSASSSASFVPTATSKGILALNIVGNGALGSGVAVAGQALNNVVNGNPATDGLIQASITGFALAAGTTGLTHKLNSKFPEWMKPEEVQAKELDNVKTVNVIGGVASTVLNASMPGIIDFVDDLFDR